MASRAVDPSCHQEDVESSGCMGAHTHGHQMMLMMMTMAVMVMVITATNSSHNNNKAFQHMTGLIHACERMSAKINRCMELL